MTDNLPAVRPMAEVSTTDTDSWVQQMGPIINLANHIAKTEFVPKNLRGSEAATAAAILYGREVGLPPMTALQQVHVVEGRPGMYAEGMRALVFAAGHEIEVVEANGARVVLRGRRRGQESWTDCAWSLDMARAANLTGKQVWKSYPRAMLTARATVELCRMIFPDVIHGFRAVEEFDDPDTTETVGQASPGGGSSPVQRRTRKSTGTKGEAVLEPRTERPALEGPPLPGEPGYTETTGTASGGEPDVVPVHDPVDDSSTPPGPSTDEGTGPEPVPSLDTAEERDRAGALDESAPPRPATKADLRMYHAAFVALAKRSDVELERDARIAITSQIIGRDVTTSNELGQAEARKIADTISHSKTIGDLYEILTAIEAGS